MKILGINEDLATAVLQYLAQRPYIEVGGMIDGLKAMPLVVPVGAPSEEKAQAEEAPATEAITPEVVEESGN